MAAATGCAAGEVVFTSGATEAAALALAGRGLQGAAVEHDCVAAWVDASLPVDGAGRVAVDEPAASVLQAANSETGVVQEPARRASPASTRCRRSARWPSPSTGRARETALVSAHKLGGPAGVGALLLAPGVEREARLRGRRAGERAAGGDRERRRHRRLRRRGRGGGGATSRPGVWDAVAEVRNILEAALESAAATTIFVGKGAPRLPNTSCVVVPGWKGETQVMQMDLAGFAVSAGSACSSGKVRASRVLTAMGLGAVAGCALRVSIGPTTTREDVLAFAGAWERHYRRFASRAA